MREEIEKIVRSVTLEDSISKDVMDIIDDGVKTYIRNIISEAFKRSLRRDPSSNTLNFNDILFVVKGTQPQMQTTRKLCIGWPDH